MVNFSIDNLINNEAEIKKLDNKLEDNEIQKAEDNEIQTAENNEIQKAENIPVR